MTHRGLGNPWLPHIDELSSAVRSECAQGSTIEDPPKSFGLRMMKGQR